jgi:L-2-hydroxyglutarate oxidase LhgO
MRETFEVVVVGAGVVGLAVAAELSKRHQVVVLERHPAFGRETSSHNSGVVHAGLYYPGTWLKTRLCIEGNALLYDWAACHGVPVRKTGKLIIATAESQLEKLEELAVTARENGVPEIERLSMRQAGELEPNVNLCAAVFSGSSGVVDQMAFMRSLEQAARGNGALFAYKHELTAIDRSAGGCRLLIGTPDGSDMEADTTLLVNCAGLTADRVAGLAGCPLDGAPEVPRLRQRLVKGRYYDIVNPAKARLVHRLVYPLPHGDRVGLGVHLTLDVDGAAHLGPDAEWLAEGSVPDYQTDDLRRDDFAAAAADYLPWLTREDIAPGQVGYRTKLHDAGDGPADFLLWRDGSYVHVGGIESPGFTASLAIARQVASYM